MLVQRWASVADVGLTLKQHWVNVISLVADINAVNPYSIGYCRPTRDRPTHARFTKKSLFVTSQEKNCLFLLREEKKCYVFLLDGKK